MVKFTIHCVYQGMFRRVGFVHVTETCYGAVNTYEKMKNLRHSHYLKVWATIE